MRRVVTASLFVMGLTIWSLVAGDWIAGALIQFPTPAASAAFPLPLSHSAIAQQMEGQSFGRFLCPKSTTPVLRVRFTLQGFLWLLFVPQDTERFLFIQYDPADQNEPLRVFVGTGPDDAIHIQRVIESPATTAPEGPCALLYPEGV